ncbi:hypothetical protein SIO70_23180 [Chitinophaga sancti]|uniref:hypothetical protein n=1 Tax=Chitinophaga sancti TaxID=1004 RepID=UPI002A74BF3B|nr:hypothetical protein [Chitinophaga sancti]WPQ61265.1 hypothetical protein SIO70_23180 [Chitinophaga sancti]
MQRLISELEETFTNVTQGNYPLEWDENHITYSLMKAMRSMFQKRQVRYKGFTKTVEWFSYKNKGKSESIAGDISLIVNIQFSSGEKLRGVAFLEAKRDSSNDNFESMSVDQLERIHAKIPYSHLLLYLHKTQEWPLKFPDESTWRSNMWASPSNTAIQMLKQVSKSDNWRTLRVSLPFSMLITSRYFWGHDLDYREDSYRLALEGLDGIAAPQFLGVINVYYEGQTPDDTRVSDNWELI